MSEVGYQSATPAARPFNRPSRNAHVPQPEEPASSAALAARLADQFGALDLFERVAAIRELIPGRIVLTTGFGLEGQAIAHAIFSQALAIDVATLDTGRLFPETYEVWAETERVYGVRILAFVPEHKSVEALVAKHGVNGLRASVEARLDCCAVRKVVPLTRILDGSSAWITGIRADQSTHRSRLSAASFDRHRRLIKVNPVFDWTREQTIEFVRRHDVPYNALHDRGFPSIGCAPCTRAVAPGEPERAGRWWWEQAGHKECGLHIGEDGRATRALAPEL